MKNATATSKLIYEYRIKKFVIRNIPYLETDNLVCRINYSPKDFFNNQNQIAWLEKIKLTVKLDKLLNRTLNKDHIIENVSYDEAIKWISKKNSEKIKVDDYEIELNNFIIEPFIATQQNEYFIRFYLNGKNSVKIIFGEIVNPASADSRFHEVIIPDFNSQDVYSAALLGDIKNEGEKALIRKFIRDAFELFTGNFTLLEINRLFILNKRVYIFYLNGQVDCEKTDLYASWNDIEFPSPNTDEVYITRLNSKFWLKLSILPFEHIMNWKVFYLSDRLIKEYYVKFEQANYLNTMSNANKIFLKMSDTCDVVQESDVSKLLKEHSLCVNSKPADKKKKIKRVTDIAKIAVVEPLKEKESEVFIDTQVDKENRSNNFLANISSSFESAKVNTTDVPVEASKKEKEKNKSANRLTIMNKQVANEVKPDDGKKRESSEENSAKRSKVSEEREQHHCTKKKLVFNDSATPSVEILKTVDSSAKFHAKVIPEPTPKEEHKSKHKTKMDFKTGSSDLPVAMGFARKHTFKISNVDTSKKRSMEKAEVTTTEKKSLLKALLDDTPSIIDEKNNKPKKRTKLEASSPFSISTARKHTFKRIDDDDDDSDNTSREADRFSVAALAKPKQTARKKTTPVLLKQTETKKERKLDVKSSSVNESLNENSKKHNIDEHHDANESMDYKIEFLSP